MTLIPVKYSLASKSGKDTLLKSTDVSTSFNLRFQNRGKVTGKKNIQTLTEQVGAGAVKALPLT